jgi:hypothetical protein
VPTAARHRSRWSAASLRASSAWPLVEPLRATISARRPSPPRPYAVRKPKDYLPRAPGDLVEVDTLDVRPSPGMLFKHFTARDPFPVAGARDVRAGGRLPRRRRYRYYVSRNLVRGSANRVQRWRNSRAGDRASRRRNSSPSFRDKAAVLDALRDPDVSRILK